MAASEPPSSSETHLHPETIPVSKGEETVEIRKQTDKVALIQACQMDILTLQGLIEKYNTQSNKKFFYRRAIIRVLNNLGGRLCYLRDSKESLGLEEKEFKMIKKMIKIRHALTHDFLYLSEEIKSKKFEGYLDEVRQYAPELKNLLQKLIKDAKPGDMLFTLQRSGVKKQFVLEEEEKEQKELAEISMLKSLEMGLQELRDMNAILENYKIDRKGSASAILGRFVEVGKNEPIQFALEDCMVNIYQSHLDYIEQLQSMKEFLKTDIKRFKLWYKLNVKNKEQKDFETFKAFKEFLEKTWERVKAIGDETMQLKKDKKYDVNAIVHLEKARMYRKNLAHLEGASRATIDVAILQTEFLPYINMLYVKAKEIDNLNIGGLKRSSLEYRRRIEEAKPKEPKKIDSASRDARALSPIKAANHPQMLPSSQLVYSKQAPKVGEMKSSQEGMRGGSKKGGKKRKRSKGGRAK